MTHLLGTRGGIACGVRNGKASPEITEVTCPRCIAIHDAYCARFEADLDEHTTPVLFRVSRAPVRNGSDVTAVFPTEPADEAGHLMTCYEHVGQHSAASHQWYRTTRPARPAEYVDLAEELTSLGYQRLKVYQRITRAMDDARVREARRFALAIGSEHKEGTA